MADAATSRALTAQNVMSPGEPNPAHTRPMAADLLVDLQSIALRDADTRRQHTHVKQSLAVLISHHHRQVAQKALDEKFAKDLDKQINGSSDNPSDSLTQTKKSQTARHKTTRATLYKRRCRCATTPSGPPGQQYTGKSQCTLT